MIDIEKQTRNRNLCEALRREIELLRLSDRMQSIVNESNCQDLSSDMSVEAEATSCKETQCQVNQSNAKIMTADDGNRVLTNLPAVFPDTVASESEYFTCTDDSNSMDIQQNNVTNTLKSCAQDPSIIISKQKNLVETETTKNDKYQSISTQDDVSVCSSNNNVEKNTIEPCTNEADEDSSNKKRKRISESDLEPSTICSSIDRNEGLLSHSIEIVISNCTKINPPRKKHKVMEIERSDSSTCDVNENIMILKTGSENSSHVRLDDNQDEKTNGTQPFVRIKLEPDETISDKCDRIVRNENINSIETNILKNEKNHVDSVSPRSLENSHCNIMSNVKKEIDDTYYSMPNRCRIKSEVDVSQYSMRIDCEENCDEKIPAEILLKSPTVCLPIHQNKLLRQSTDIAGTSAKICLPRKKHEFMESGKTSDLLKITDNSTDKGADKNVKTLTIKEKNRSKVSLDKKQDKKIHEILTLEKIKLEPNDTEVTSSLLSPTETSYSDLSQNKSSREKSSTQESAKPAELRSDLNIGPVEKNILENRNNQGSSNILAKLHRNIMSKLKNKISVSHYSAPVPIECRMNSETDVSHFPIRIDQEENCGGKTNNEISLNKEKVSSDFEDSNKALNDSVILQNSESICENQNLSPHAPTHTGENTEVTVVEKSTDTDSEANKDQNENIVVRKRKCLIDEEAFERERAMLDKRFGRTRLDKESRKAALDKVLEKMNKRNQKSKTDFYIFGEHERLFEKIVVTIMREYYPSCFIPNDLCFSKVLQRLQIDLAGADMCGEFLPIFQPMAVGNIGFKFVFFISDDDIASYTRDSIKTMRYLCDHCIVQ